MAAVLLLLLLVLVVVVVVAVVEISGCSCVEDRKTQTLASRLRARSHHRRVGCALQKITIAPKKKKKKKALTVHSLRSTPHSHPRGEARTCEDDDRPSPVHLCAAAAGAGSVFALAQQSSLT